MNLEDATFQQRLGEGLTLRLLVGEATVFSSRRHWLHPLFELEALQEVQPIPGLQEALLIDRVTGAAAAFLVASLGIRHLWTGTLSRRAIPILEAYGIAFQSVTIIDRIVCATEDEFASLRDLDAARAQLRIAQQRALARHLPAHEGLGS